MAEIVNLRQARKNKARSEENRVAEQNRAAFGRPKAERVLERRTAERADRLLDGHRLTPELERMPGQGKPDRDDA